MSSYTELAKKAVETYIKKGEIIKVPSGLPEEMLKKKAGTFVTIEKKENLAEKENLGERILKEKSLRGCIGTYLPTKENIAQEIIHNAIAAATEDYRFGQIQKEELPSLTYTVYILGAPELVKDIKKELDPKIYGIIVKTNPIVNYPRPEGEARPEGAANGTDVVFNGHFVPKSALLLPDLEGIDTIEKQISVACQKGGIDPLKEDLIIYRFKVEKYD